MMFPITWTARPYDGCAPDRDNCVDVIGHYNEFTLIWVTAASSCTSPNACQQLRNALVIEDAIPAVRADRHVICTARTIVESR